MKGTKSEDLETPAAQGTWVAYQLLLLLSSCTTDSGSSHFMKTKSKNRSVCKSLLLSDLTCLSPLGKGEQTA